MQIHDDSWETTANVSASGALFVTQVNASGTAGTYADKTAQQIISNEQNDILRSILDQLKILNAHQAIITDEEIKRE